MILKKELLAPISMVQLEAVQGLKTFRIIGVNSPFIDFVFIPCP